jgi:lysophospholipase L1-like esterase
MRRFAISLLLLAGTLYSQTFKLQDGDTVVFYGDSITDQRLYTTFAETYVITRFPKLNIRFVHSGWGGDRVSGGAGGNVDLRLRRDVLPYRPTVMTIMLGMNDGRYRAYDPRIFSDFAAGYEKIIHDMHTALPSLRITVIEPSPYDDVTRTPMFEGGYNAVLVRYGQFLRDLAGREHLQVADLNTPVVRMLGNAKSRDAKLAERIIPDRVHPGPGGHLIMAEALLKSWDAPALVTDVEIDAAAKAVKRSENTKVTMGDGLSWTQLDNALPMPVDLRDPVIALAVASSDFMDALNQEGLRVTGLAAGSYTLRIDGESVGTFTAANLESGLNLATLPTPMVKQAAEVHSHTLKHNNVHFFRWRTLQTTLEPDGFRTAQSEALLDALEEQIVGAQRLAVQPRLRKYDLTPAK